jgi:5-methylcytosine-specific restriction enzyme B
MATAWKIAPGKRARVWRETRDQQCITINWMNQTNFGRFETEEELKEAMRKANEPVKGSASIWAFVRRVQPGHTVVANKGDSQLVGIGILASAYLPPSHADNPRRTAKEHRHARRMNWEIDTPINLPREFFGHMPPTVKQLTSEQCRKIKRAYLKLDRSLKDKLDRLLPDDDTQQAEGTMRALLQQLGQVIVYGPPGTGKTREAKRVALGLLTGKDLAPEAISSEDEIEEDLERFRAAGRFDIVVFHPAYEYEQFIGGIGPAVEGANLRFQAKAGPCLFSAPCCCP